MPTIDRDGRIYTGPLPTGSEGMKLYRAAAPVIADARFGEGSPNDALRRLAGHARAVPLWVTTFAGWSATIDGFVHAMDARAMDSLFDSPDLMEQPWDLLIEVWIEAGFFGQGPRLGLLEARALLAGPSEPSPTLTPPSGE